MSDYNIIFALMANLSFAVGGTIFAQFARSVSSLWMNTLKAIFALLCFIVATGIFSNWVFPLPPFLLMLILSGFIGLGIGDIFMLKGFALIGASRTLMVFGIQPLVLGGLSFLFLDQVMPATKFLAIFFFMTCLYIFSLEQYRKNGLWDLKGMLFALTAVTLDSVGIIFTRKVFNQYPGMSPFESNTYRCLGALIAFLILSRFIPINLVSRFQALKTSSKVIVLIGCFMGTFLSLSFHLEAIKTSHLATLSALSITGPLFTAAVESLIERKPPSRYWFYAFPFFALGVLTLTYFN